MYAPMSLGVRTSASGTWLNIAKDMNRSGTFGFTRCQKFDGI